MSLPDSTTALAGPIAEPDRFRSLDILRGVAVLGIFVMNSRDFALPLRQFDNPAFPGKPGSPAQPSDLWAWAIENTFFEDKMIAIFSMLFGAGIVMAAARSTRPALIHYRRMFWLFLIGLAHAYGLWYGDILNTYAICGVALYPFRRLPPAILIALGIATLTVAVWARAGPGIANTMSPEPPSATPVESRADRIWRESNRDEKAAYTGSYLDLARWGARLNIFWHWDGCISFNFWRCGGFILIGMGLVQLGVLSGARPASFSVSLLIGGYATGLALFAVGFWPLLARALGHSAEMPLESRRVLALATWTLRYSAAPGIALGHIGLVMLLCRARALDKLLAPLAAVGRLALTNYLLQTVISVLIFDGWSGGQWSKWRMIEIAALVLGVWILQLTLSPIYLRAFRFGPMEWLWRSLTYWKLQPLRAAPRHASPGSPADAV